MKYLLIDTTTSYVTVSILNDDVEIYNYHEKILNDMSSKILPIIDDGLKKSNLSINDIDKIFVCNGPGSFTGIRIGVTIAKTIALFLKKKIVPISSLELMSTTKTDKEFLIPMIDARRENVFAGVYDTELNVVVDDKLISLQDLCKYPKDKYEFISYDELSIDTITPRLDIPKIIRKHKNDEGLNPHTVNPKYLKLTEAEENKLNHDKRN